MLAAMIPSAWKSSTGRAIPFLALRKKPQAIDEFLKTGANVNQADDEGGTPLIYAAQFGDLALMKTLVARGAKVDPIDRKGYSALSYLAAGKNYKSDAVVFLIAHGAKLNVVNNEGHAPLHLAAMRSCKPTDADRQTELLKLLVDGGADPNATPTGELPLHLAAYAGQSDKALDYLLQVTKEPHALSHAGYTAFTEAARGDQHDAVLFFARHGFEPQNLPPALPPEPASAPSVEPTFPINARAHAAYGDYWQSQANFDAALGSYQKSATNYQAAIDGYRRVIAYNTALLKSEKDARRGKWISVIALNVVGAGVGAATGVGFFVVPKKTEDQSDDHEDELERQQTELAVLTKEQSALKIKIKSIEAPLTTTPKVSLTEEPKAK